MDHTELKMARTKSSCMTETQKQTDRQTDRQTDTDGLTDRQTDTDGQTDGQNCVLIKMLLSVNCFVY